MSCAGYPAQISVIVPRSRLLSDIIGRAAEKLHFDVTAVELVSCENISGGADVVQDLDLTILPEGTRALVVNVPMQLDDSGEGSADTSAPPEAEGSQLGQRCGAPRAKRRQTVAQLHKRQTVEQLRARTQHLMEECRARGVAVSQLDLEQQGDQFQNGTERSNSRRGNTKSDKRRRRKADWVRNPNPKPVRKWSTVQDALSQLVLHLEHLLVGTHADV